MDMSDVLKKILLTGVGAVATTMEAANELVDTLVKKGEITVEQGKVLNEELVRNAKAKAKEHVTVNIVRESMDVDAAVETMSKEEREALKAKLKAMEEAEAADAEEAAAQEEATVEAEEAAADTPAEAEKESSEQ